MRRSRPSHSTINSHRVSPSLQHRPPAAQIPIAEHVARRGPPNAPKSRFRPLAVFVRRPPAFVARFEAAGIRKPSQNPNLPRRSIAVRFAPNKQTPTRPVRCDAMVESRIGAVAWAMRRRSVSHPRSSNRTCGFPASGSPTGFVLRHRKQITRQSPSPCLLRKHTRSQGPSLHRHYPASTVILPCPTPADAAARSDV
jgi:hypothetical protein